MDMNFDDINPYKEDDDVSIMTDEEYRLYGYGRMRIMIKMEQDALMWYKKKQTPFQRLVLDTAHHHVEQCEKEFGISRYDMSLF